MGFGTDVVSIVVDVTTVIVSATPSDVTVFVGVKVMVTTLCDRDLLSGASRVVGAGRRLTPSVTVVIVGTIAMVVAVG